MRPISVTLGPYAAGVTNGISTAQTLTTPPFTFLINGSLASGGAAVLDAPRQVAITSAGNDSGVIFTVNGTNANGDPIGEQVRGASGAVATTNTLFKRVYAVSASGPTSSVTIGTVTAPWFSSPIRLDEWAEPQIGVQVAVTGTVNYTVQSSFDEGPDSLTNPIPLASMTWDTSTAIGLPAAAGTATASFGLTVAPLWLRIALNSGTGSVRMNVVQYNNYTT
jgi:hypothetical protein